MAIIADELKREGFAIEATLVHDYFNAWNNRLGQSVWAVTISHSGQSMQIEYSTGSAHRHYRSGKPIKMKYHGLTVWDCDGYAQTKPNAPELADVLYSVVSDAQGVAFGQSFDDWAGDYGYDEDSRRAEKAFNACRDEYFDLIRLCGREGFETLCELFEDY